MTIVLLAEGATEVQLRRHLKQFLDERAKANNRPLIKLESRQIEPFNRLKHQVELQLAKPDVTAVIGLIDVFPKFHSAREVKTRLKQTVGRNKRFHAHAAQFDIEAWLLPYTEQIRKLVGRKNIGPYRNPENINSTKPPSYVLTELCRTEKKSYSKPERLEFILKGQNLTVAADACPEFKALLNTLLQLSDLPLLD